MIQIRQLDPSSLTRANLLFKQVLLNLCFHELRPSIFEVFMGIQVIVDVFLWLFLAKLLVDFFTLNSLFFTEIVVKGDWPVEFILKFAQFFL